MARRIITLKYPAVCADKKCGARLPAGSRARYYGRGRVYGVDCHDKNGRNPDFSEMSPHDIDNMPRGLVYSMLDPHGIYASDGTKLGSSCGCEDYPCCGH